ncbi:PglL family O-oligosaccharyltransferase [Roseateles toxinivorans]|uniref:O-antigen ligase n=1 Tax=Roseateles toxinivorans TaxID=270368 RepID=A0A4R6QS46_9BURK|nr:O-antigen ligase family protein [Roseateles toxinivorans]TDP73075.1 O-antigen ligase [Roseateles toxinivorans]
MSTSPERQSPELLLAALVACSLASLIAYNQPPSATLFNQVAALLAWGGFAMLLLIDRPALRVELKPASAALAALLLLMLAAGASVLWAGLPTSLALHAVALLAAAMVMLLVGRAVHQAGQVQYLLTLLCLGWVLVGVLSAAVGGVQVFAPQWADGDWIARSTVAGRAISNMRQPNHLASLLMWSCVAVIWLGESQRLRREGVWALLGLFVFTVMLSASRTGMVGVAILALWGLLDSKLTRASRLALLGTPLMLGLSWWLLGFWADSGHAFGAATRLSAEGAGSPSRLAILANAWELVKQNPLTGVGWGEFNLAWTMTPFPGRPVAFFDHTHNLPMQLMVELGLPLALLVLGLLGWALYRAFAAGQRAVGSEAVALRCAFMMVLMIGLHSLLEYPLWYAYFLLPTALFLGLCLGPAGDAAEASAGWSLRAGVLVLGGGLMVLGSLLTLVDYRSVVVIYAPPAGAASLETRIHRGQQSPLFAAQADYAAATTLPPGPEALEATRRTAHNLIDVRLMMAWAQSLHAIGDDERARYVVERLREFHSPQAEEWLAVCGEPRAEGELRPFQCEPVTRVFEFREMR